MTVWDVQADLNQFSDALAWFIGVCTVLGVVFAALVIAREVRDENR